MVAYTLSLVTTVGVMLVFNHAQPALLYIVPYVLIASLSVGLYLGEMRQLLAFEVVDVGEELAKVKNDAVAKAKEKSKSD